MAANIETGEAADERSAREVETDILVRLARIEGLLDGFLLGLGARAAVKAGQPEPAE